MVRQNILLALTCFVAAVSFAQNAGAYYVAGSGGKPFDRRLIFLNDSTVEMRKMLARGVGEVISVYHYSATDTTINILNLPADLPVDSLSSLYKADFYRRRVISLKRIEGLLIDDRDSIIYVREKDYFARRHFLFIIDGKRYILDLGKSNSYGLVTKSGKKNRKLEKKLRNINKDNSTIQSLKGFAAYKQYGLKNIFGVIIIDRN